MTTSDRSSSDLTKSMNIKTIETTAGPKDQSRRISKSFSMMNIGRDHQSSLNYIDDQDHSQEYSCYHGGSSASVPFIWESQPGTPKVARLREASLLPPLTPPPSYWSSPAANRPSAVRTQANRRSNRPSFVKALFPNKKPFLPSSLSSPSSSSSASSRSSSYNYSCSPPSTPSRLGAPRQAVSCPKLTVESRVDQEDEDHGPPVSTLCFGRMSINSRIGSGCYSSFMKVLLN